MELYSYHVFLFPFQWEMQERKSKPFSERFSLDEIFPIRNSDWENLPDPATDQYKVELYNEKNYFYQFTHKALYDQINTNHHVIKHFERAEAYTNNLEYIIGINTFSTSNAYTLRLKSIGLDLFSTGTGILMFYLENDRYSSFEDVKLINQFGRRVYPPYLTANMGVEGTKRAELADYIRIAGLKGDESKYYEDFNDFSPSDIWRVARFLKSLINDFNPEMTIEPVVDDRMFTMSWILNDDLSKKIKDDKEFYKFIRSGQWHEYLFVDSGDSTCQNLRMRKNILDESTYPRWQKYGTLFGITRYSFTAISENNQFIRDVILTHFRTMYVRMTELALIQRASILKFSSEVTRLSILPFEDSQKIANELDEFYKSYIRFVNQVYFREITAQEQGIEMYDKLIKSMRIEQQVKDLDREIEELHNYATLLDDKAQSKNIRLITILGSLFLAPSFIASYFGMNLIKDDLKSEPWFLPLIAGTLVFIALGFFGIVEFRRRKIKLLVYVFTALVILAIIASMTMSLVKYK